MQIRKRSIIFMIALAAVFFIIGAGAELVVTNKTYSKEDSWSAQDFLGPSSETSRTIIVTQPFSWLHVTLNSTDSLQLFIEFNGTMEYSKDGGQLQGNFLLNDIGEHDVKFVNGNSFGVNYNYELVLTTLFTRTEQPYSMFLAPLLIAGETSLFLILPICFYDNIKTKLMKKGKKTIIEIAIFAFVAALALGFVPLLSIITGTSQPFVSPTSSSMVPTIKPGDLAFVVGTQPQNLKVGDILVYGDLVQNVSAPIEQKISPSIMHRIANITTENGQRYFITKGDNNLKADDWYVPQDGVEGKAIFVIPYLGTIFQTLSLIQVKIIILLVTALIFVFWPSKKKKPEN